MVRFFKSVIHAKAAASPHGVVGRSSSSYVARDA